jgi:hypothetical protein
MYNRGMEEKKIQVRFPTDVWEAMKQLAIQHERSFNGEVLWALRAYITQQKGEPRESVHIPPVPDQQTN